MSFYSILSFIGLITDQETQVSRDFDSRTLESKLYFWTNLSSLSELLKLKNLF